MKTFHPKPLFWRMNTLLSLGTDHVHELALRACGSLTSLRLLLGRCLLALQENKGYKQFGCSSSVHYAAQILGVDSREARECRRVARELQPLAELSVAAEQGTISWSKLREVVRKAAPETEGYWLALCATFNAKQIQKLVRETPWGSVPGDVFEEEEPMTTELRCPMSPRVFRMLSQARRLYSIEQEEAVSNAEIVEMALATYIAGRPADTEVLNKARDEADKDLQAEEARRLPLVNHARELAQEMGLLGGASSELQDAVTSKESCVELDASRTRASGLLAQALGAPTADENAELCPNDRPTDDPERLTWVAADIWNPTDSSVGLHSWSNARLRFNSKNRLATKAQKKELLRRDGWCCSTPGCSHKIWLHLHHLKSYAQGGETVAENLCSLCSGCHANLHAGDLQIKVDTDGALLFLDGEGRRLDRHCSLEVAGWLDWWHGWRGCEEESHHAKVQHGFWEVAG